MRSALLSHFQCATGSGVRAKERIDTCCSEEPSGAGSCEPIESGSPGALRGGFERCRGDRQANAFVILLSLWLGLWWLAQVRMMEEC